MATAVASRPGARVYGGCHKDHGEQQNGHSPRAH